MTKSITAIGFSLEPKQSDMLDSKLKRISYAEDLIMDLIIHIKHENSYIFDITINLKKGAQIHLSGSDFDFAAALNKTMDVLDNKIKKEKDKIQEKNK